MGQQPTKSKMSWGLYRFIDIRQPEVKWAAGISIFMEFLFAVLSLHSNFSIYENDLCSLIQCVIAGLISLIGVAIAGIAIVIALFTTEEIKTINELVPKAFDDLLYDFKWFALVSAIEAAIFVAMIFVIRSPYPVAPMPLFYLATFLLVYGVFYLLFYGCALVGNFIKMARIKCSLDTALMQSKGTPISAIEVELDFLVSKLFHGDKQASSKFYSELIKVMEKSTFSSKGEIVDYLKKRYTNF